MTVFMVLGQTPSPDGKVDSKFREKMLTAVALLRNYPHSILLITGGVTQPGQPSEAEGGFQLVPEDLKSRVLLEKKSLSTRQNILFSKEILSSYDIDSLFVLSTPGHKVRFSFLLNRNWPEITAKYKFVPVGTDSFREKIIHGVITVLTLLDPEQKKMLSFKKYFLWIL